MLFAKLVTICQRTYSSSGHVFMLMWTVFYPFVLSLAQVINFLITQLQQERLMLHMVALWKIQVMGLRAPLVSPQQCWSTYRRAGGLFLQQRTWHCLEQHNWSQLCWEMHSKLDDLPDKWTNASSVSEPSSIARWTCRWTLLKPFLSSVTEVEPFLHLISTL